MLNKTMWYKEIPVPESVISLVDAGVRKMLPAGTEVRGICPSGESFWARTATIDASDDDGETRYFLKVIQGEHGKRMVAAEYNGMVALHKRMPDFVVEPIGYGSYESIEDTHFFISTFVEMSGEVPSVEIFPSLVAEMHKRGASNNKIFGFTAETFGGNKPQMFEASEMWEECFAKGMKGIFQAERDTQGQEAEMTNLEEIIMHRVIPRLLRPLETEGRSITPTLVHGDLWDGNAALDVTTGRPVIFDATPLLAHHEYELGPWHCIRHEINQEHINEYIKHFPPSEPTEEFDDRGALYELRFELHASSLYPGNHTFRENAGDIMKELVRKYEEGYGGYAQRKGLAF